MLQVVGKTAQKFREDKYFEILLPIKVHHVVCPAYLQAYVDAHVSEEVSLGNGAKCQC